MGGEPFQETILGYRGHGHHVMFKVGKGAAQKEIVGKATRYLELYDIDWYGGLKNLVQAPNGGGIHGTEILRKTYARILQKHRQNREMGLTLEQGKYAMEMELQRIGAHVKNLDFDF